MKRFRVKYKLEGTATLNCGFEVNAESEEELQAILKAKPWHEWNWNEPTLFKGEFMEIADTIECFDPGSDVSGLTVEELK